MNHIFVIILVIFCSFGGEAILTWSLSNNIDSLPTSLINPLWHLLEQTVILLWRWTHHHQLEKKIEYPFADVRQTIAKPTSVTSTINPCASLKEKDSSQDRFVVVLFCFLNQFCWQLFPYDTTQGCLSELRVHLCRKIHFKASKNTKHLILM